MRFNYAKIIFVLLILFFTGFRLGSLLNPADAGPATAAALSTADISADSRASDVASQTEPNLPAMPGTPLFLRASNDPPPQLDLQSAVISNPRTGETYFEVSPDKRWPIASLTKLMTAAVAMQYMDMHAPVVFDPSDLADIDPRFVNVIHAGDKYDLQTVLKFMLVTSSNECARAVARTYGTDAFLAKMNETAAAWGLSSTYFQDPTGLSASNQSTAQNVADMVRHIYAEEPNIFQMTRAKSATLGKSVAAIHPFVNRPDFLGGKTGHTPEAGGNLVSLISYGRAPVLIVVLGTDDRFAASQSLLDWFEHDFSPSR